jgi:hypothetical protein
MSVAAISTGNAARRSSKVGSRSKKTEALPLFWSMATVQRLLHLSAILCILLPLVHRLVRSGYF